MDKSNESSYIPLADIIPADGESEPFSDPLIAEYEGVKRMLAHISTGRQLHSAGNRSDDLVWVRSTSLRYPQARTDSYHITRMREQIEQAEAEPNSTSSLNKLHNFGYVALSAIYNHPYLQPGTVFENSDELPRIHHTMRLQKIAYDASELALNHDSTRIEDVNEARAQADIENLDQSLAAAIAMTGRELVPPFAVDSTRGVHRFIYGTEIGQSDLVYDRGPNGSIHKKAVRNRLRSNAGTEKTLGDRIRIIDDAFIYDRELLNSLKKVTGYDKDGLTGVIADAHATLTARNSERARQLNAESRALANSAFMRSGAFVDRAVTFEEERAQNSEVLSWETYRDVVHAAIDSDGDFIPLPFANPSMPIVKKDDIPSLIRGSVSALGADMVESVPDLDISEPISFGDFKASRIVNLSEALLNKYNGTVLGLEVRVLPIDPEDYSSLGLGDVNPELLACMTIRAKLKNNRTSEVSTYVYYAKNETSSDNSAANRSRLVATVRKNELTAAAKFVREYLEKSKLTGRSIEARAITHPLRGGLVNPR